VPVLRLAGSMTLTARSPGRRSIRIAGDTDRAALRVARREAEEPVRDPLLDATRILVLAQRLAAEQVNGPHDDPEAA
jgi:hypothetical protein